MNLSPIYMNTAGHRVKASKGRVKVICGLEGVRRAIRAGQLDWAEQQLDGLVDQLGRFLLESDRAQIAELLAQLQQAKHQKVALAIADSALCVSDWILQGTVRRGDACKEQRIAAYRKVLVLLENTRNRQECRYLSSKDWFRLQQLQRTIQRKLLQESRQWPLHPFGGLRAAVAIVLAGCIGATTGLVLTEQPLVANASLSSLERQTIQ
jgi:hypothetical protein